MFAKDYRGLIFFMAIRGKEVVKETDQQVWLKIGAGENWHQVVRFAVDRGWGGIENLSLIPGTAGAAPIQNIGAYGVELRDVFEELTAVQLDTGDVRKFDRASCEFGYRDSIFKGELKGRYAVTSITLRLSKEPELQTSYGAIRERLEKREIDQPTIRDVSDIVIDIRNSKLPDPAKLGNAGSFFKNPVIEAGQYEQLVQSYPEMPGYTMEGNRVKVPAGWLIEACGWKGKVIGHTGTYRQQALVIVNHGGATAEEILNLARAIRQSVREKFGIALVPEVNIIQ